MGLPERLLIARNSLKSGSVLPLSQFVIVASETPIFSANSLWLRPAFTLHAAMQILGIVLFNILYLLSVDTV